MGPASPDVLPRAVLERDAQPIADFVGVRSHPTVVRLEDAVGADWIADAYLLTDEVRAHVETLRRALSQPHGAGIFLVGQYGSGKSHLLAWLTQRLRAGALVEAPPDVVAASLLNYRADTRLEDVVGEVLGIAPGAADRRVGWSALMERHPRGLLLILDELSEFLRSKSDARAFNEDIRFLQFMGEWARDARLFVLAAMQEALERTGALEGEQYKKIKDRFRLRLRLTPSHVRELIAGSILVKRPGYASAVDGLIDRLRAAWPGAAVDFAALADIYPVHPATLELLEEVRDRFSQTRGVVDFVTRRLAGYPELGVAPFLDRPFGELLGPDAIVAHFEDVLELQPEFLGLATKLFPWMRRHLGEVFPEERPRALAERLLRLLVLTWLAPGRADLGADEAAWWLLFTAARIDPDRNVRVVRRLLDTLVDHGRYVRREGERYRLDLEDDGGGALDRLLARAVADLPPPDEALDAIAEGLAPAGGGFDPFRLRRDAWQGRTYSWRFHERSYAVWLGNTPPTPRPAAQGLPTLGPPTGGEGLALCVRLPWGAAAPADGCATVIPKALAWTPDLQELAALIRLRERPHAPEVTAALDRRLAERATVFRVKVREAYAGATLTGPRGEREPALPLNAADALERWLDEHALWLLRKRFPRFEAHAPTHGPLPVPRVARPHALRAGPRSGRSRRAGRGVGGARGIPRADAPDAARGARVRGGGRPRSERARQAGPADAGRTARAPGHL